MVKPPNKDDLTSGITDEESPINNHKVSALVNNTPEEIGYLYSRIDLLNDRSPRPSGYEDPSAEDLVATIDQLDELVRENVDELLTNFSTFYHTAFGNFLEINRWSWEEIFGETPPGPLDSWDPVWTYGRKQFTYIYQTNAEAHREHSIDVDEFDYIIKDTYAHILPLRITPALALSEVGSMSLLQAQTYVLHQWGYETSAIAELLDKPVGTVSSHLNRGKKKATQAVWMSEFIGKTQDSRPVDYNHIIDRVGNVYKSRTEDWWRITDLHNDDEELVYEMMAEDTEKTVTVEEFTRTSGYYTEKPVDEAPAPLREAEIMDIEEFMHDD